MLTIRDLPVRSPEHTVPETERVKNASPKKSLAEVLGTRRDQEEQLPRNSAERTRIESR